MSRKLVGNGLLSLWFLVAAGALTASAQPAPTPVPPPVPGPVCPNGQCPTGQCQPGQCRPGARVTLAGPPRAAYRPLRRHLFPRLARRLGRGGCCR